MYKMHYSSIVSEKSKTKKERKVQSEHVQPQWVVQSSEENVLWSKDHKFKSPISLP